MEITLRVLEYRVLKQLENPSKTNKENILVHIKNMTMF